MDSCARLPTLWAHGHIPIIGNGVPVTATLKELSQALMHGVIDPETLADHFISRIEGSPDATVYINTTFDRARHEAAESARAMARATEVLRRAGWI